MDTTSNQLVSHNYYSSPSSCSPPPSRWDVFLSFRGKDTRANFIAQLYKALDQAGIITFMDDPELEKGEEISPALLEAIRSSKKFVVVLSENYADSPWCLDELVEILLCKRKKNQVVIPVFFYVNPADVRYQKENFGKALEIHKNKKRYSDDTMGKWKSALAEIGDLSGYHLRENANENEAETVQKIVEVVAPPKVLHLDKYLFGIDSVVKEIYQKLSMESNDIRAIVISGMGGIGKTTAAKAFYNRYSNKFVISCFVENAKQYSQGGSPLLSLLEQLLIQLLRRKDYKVHNVESGILQLEKILLSKKTLIVLDDLDQSELLVTLRNFFSAGSRIIITTRDANLLRQLKDDISEVDIYMVKKLGEIDSLELFSYHAFRKPMPPVNFKELSLRFVTYVGGLPLALKVLGSSLRGRTDVLFWEAQLEKVRVNPEIHKILKLSYDELGYETEKAIFLDIVFFFVGKDKDEAVHIFKSCNFLPDAGIPILVERCLLTIDEYNKFQMHNLIQDMGREVIREESKQGKCKRLYLCEGNAWNALQNQEGTDKIEGLILDLTTSTTRHLDANIFKRLPNLRLLEIIEAHDIKGNLQDSFYELRCIRWSYCRWTRLPSTFHPQKLVSLDMPFSKFKTLWKHATPLVKLKTINVSYSENLKTTHDFRDLKLLEKLSLRGCNNLLEVHPSIGQLTNLGYLDLGGCYHLKALPEPIGHLTKLGHLDLRNCVNLKRLPEPIKKLTNLVCLDLRYCRNLKQLPEQLGDMKGLRTFDARNSAIEQLPDSFADLKELVELNLSFCKKFRKLPEQFGNMERLTTFDASFSAIEQLPGSFVQLINLVDLRLSYCKKLTRLPNGIWNLKLLKLLSLHNCSKLERLPDQLEKMQCLEELDASYTAIEELPNSIGELSRLHGLNLDCCQKLKYLPTSIGNLTSLESLYLCHNDTLKKLPDSLENMKKLETLTLECNIRLCLPIIMNLSSLKTLHLFEEGQSLSSTKRFSLSKLSNLRDLALHSCASLGSSFPELPLNLEQLSLRDYATLEHLPDLSSLKQLKRLDIRRCINLQSFQRLPPHLRTLEAHECTSLQDVPDLSMLKELRTLRFTGCSNLKSVSLNQSSLQVGRDYFSSFKADLPNKRIPEWFSYKNTGSKVAFDIPPILGDNFVGVALWAVHECKNADGYSTLIRVVITNKTQGITNNYDIYASTDIAEGEVQSRVECISGNRFSVKSGDKIKVSFQSLIISTDDDGVTVAGKAKVERCGVHVIQKNTLHY